MLKRIAIIGIVTYVSYKLTNALEKLTIKIVDNHQTKSSTEKADNNDIIETYFVD